MKTKWTYTHIWQWKVILNVKLTGTPKHTYARANCVCTDEQTFKTHVYVWIFQIRTQPVHKETVFRRYASTMTGFWHKNHSYQHVTVELSSFCHIITYLSVVVDIPVPIHRKPNCHIRRKKWFTTCAQWNKDA